MKKLYKLLEKVSEARVALNTYQADTKPDEVRAEKVTELSGNLNAAEGELRAECARLQVESQKEEPVKRSLTERISLRNYVDRAARDRPFEGAEAEYNKEIGLDDRHVVPFAALLPTEDEARADVVTPVAADSIQHPQAAPVLGRVFRNTRVAFLGARMPSVASGEPVFPVMLDTNAMGGFPLPSAIASGAGGGPVSPMAEGEEIESVAAAFTGYMVSPKRISGRYTWRMEDIAKLPIEGILRADLREMMGWQLDFQVLNGGLAASSNYFGAYAPSATWAGLATTNARNFSGIRAELPAPSGDGDSTVALGFTEVLKIVSTGIDGLFANTHSDLRMLVGTETYKGMTQTFKESAGGTLLDRSTWEYLRSIGVSMEASGIIPDVGEAADAGVHPAHGTTGKQEAIMTSRGSDLVIPIWEGITMIRDPYTGAAKGETALTAHMLANVQFLRKSAWRRLNFKLV